MYAQQLLEDEKTIENHVEKTTMSLAGKYMPREKKASFEKSWGAAKQIRAALKAQSQQPWDNKRYRQLKTKLGAALDVCEVKMCANTRCQITIQKMPSRALMRYKRYVWPSKGECIAHRPACMHQTLRANSLHECTGPSSMSRRAHTRITWSARRALRPTLRTQRLS